jgi:glycosyltransferase involved in cell wall biosynthesis
MIEEEARDHPGGPLVPCVAHGRQAVSSISKGRPKVLFVTPRYAPFVGGIETHVAEVSRRLVDDGFDITVLTVDPARSLPPVEDHDGVRILRVGSTGSDLYWSPELYRVVRAGDWQLVHCQGIHTLVPAIAMLAARRSRTPYLVTFHTGGHDSRLRMRLRWLQWLVLSPLLRRAAGLIAVSQFEAALWHRVPGLAWAPIEIIPNGAEMPSLDPLPDPDPDLIISVGRLVRYKGHERAIAALPDLAAMRPGVRLRIVGHGDQEAALRRTAGRLGVADRLEIAGIPGRDRVAMARLMASAGAVLLLSEYEAHPVAVLEAASLGRPVIAADTTGLHELIARGLARGVPLHASPRVVAEAVEGELRAPSRAPQELPSWDICAASLRDRYRAILAPAFPLPRPAIGGRPGAARTGEP